MPGRGGAQVIVGLGNPGAEYRGTRHNVGHAVLARLARRLQRRFRVHGPGALAEAEWDGGRLYLAKPVAFMNAMGPSVARLLHTLELDPSGLIVVHDDLDLPFGRVRMRQRGRHGGHNGLRSLIEVLGTEGFRRVKVGIGRPASRSDVVEWVLTDFAPDERETLPDVLERAADAALALAAKGS